MRYTFFLIALFTVLWSCQNAPAEDTVLENKEAELRVDDEAKKKNLLEEIKSLEQQLFADDKKINTEPAKKLIDKTEELTLLPNTRQESPGYLYKAADVAQGIGQPERAIAILEKAYNKYKDFPQRPNCLFIIGFIYENDLKDLEKAQVFYKSFLERYPDHHMANAAKASLNNLNKSPEDLIKEFQKKNNQ